MLQMNKTWIEKLNAHIKASMRDVTHVFPKVTSAYFKQGESLELVVRWPGTVGLSSDLDSFRWSFDQLSADYVQLIGFLAGDSESTTLSFRIGGYDAARYLAAKVNAM